MPTATPGTGSSSPVRRHDSFDAVTKRRPVTGTLGSTYDRAVAWWTQLKARVRALLAADDVHPQAGQTLVTPEDQIRANYAIRLALNYAGWLHRRTETIRFIGARSVRRRMTADYTLLPDQALGTAGLETVYVPVMILRKTNLRHFDLTDGHGHALSVMSASQNAALISAGLAAALDQYWPANAQEPAEETLHRIIGAVEPSTARANLDVLLQPGQVLRAALDNIAQRFPNRPDVAEVIEALISELAEGFVLLVPVSYRPGQRRLLKFTYDAAHPLRTGAGAAEDQPLSKARLWMLRSVASLGLAPKVERFKGLQLGWSDSYHVEIDPPPETDILWAELTINDGADEWIAARDIDTDRSHLWVGKMKRGDKGSLTVCFAVQRQSLVLPLFFAAFVIAGVLAFVPKHANEIDTEALGALLVLPLALSAYYARVGEDSYVRTLMLPLRLIAAVSVAMGFFVLGLVSVSQLEENLCLAKIAAWVAISATLLLFMALMAPSIDRREPTLVRTGGRKPTEEIVPHEPVHWPPILGILAGTVVIICVLAWRLPI